MERSLILTKSAGKFTDESAIIVGKNDDLTLKIDSIYDLSEAVIAFNNGTVIKSYRLTNDFTVPSEVIFSGWLNIAITMYADGEIVKKWKILPIKIVENDGFVDYNERVSSFENQLSTKAEKATVENIEKIVTELVEKHNKLTEIVNLLKEN